ncbi:MAG: HDIG domain-containing protein [Defluviitaleaceae bacterium]|nr:HDIG domain-containing protein [Defluviitaleaceae bacterium]
MRKRSYRQQKRERLPLYTVVLVLIAYVASLVIGGLHFIVPDTVDLAVGDIAPRDFAATRVVENIYRTRINRESAAAAVELQFEHDPEITYNILFNLQSFFEDVGAERARAMPLLIPPDFDGAVGAAAPPDPRHPFNHLIVQDSPTFARFINEVSTYFEDALYMRIHPGNAHNTALGLGYHLNEVEFDDILVSMGREIAHEFLVSNMVFNEAETERLRAEAMDAADVPELRVGQNIVRSGDFIDEEAYLILVELGVIGVSVATIIQGLLGVSFVVTIVFGICMFYVYVFKKDVAFDRRKVTMLFTLYMMAVLLLRVMVFLPFYFTPIMLFAILCALLIGTRLSLVFTLSLSMIAMVIDPMNSPFIAYAIINGTLAALIAKKITVRANMWMAAGIFVLANAATVFASYFIFAAGLSDAMFTSALLAMVGGVMTITLAYGSLPIWESVFKVVTQNTLLELTDPNNALLRRLLIETPGTYHHSLVVANMAEAACFDIEANHVLARVGAYYHDIGKMKYPQYFAENQTDHNPHDSLPPSTSVEVINDHVTGGLALASEYKLPTQVADFIEQHHGNSIMKAFYFKEKEAMPEGLSPNEADFRYPNPIPQSRETAVVMLADVCEAAVRSVFGKGDKDYDEIEPFVRKLIKDKLNDGQLNDSGLSIKDLDTIAMSFMRVFRGMHHERVPYPTSITPIKVEEAFERR